jgi:hypothetical protein
VRVYLSILYIVQCVCEWCDIKLLLITKVLNAARLDVDYLKCVSIITHSLSHSNATVINMRTTLIVLSH